MDVDRFIVQTRGNVNDQRAIQTQMKTKALALTWTKTFFKGDVAQDPKSFDEITTKTFDGKRSLVVKSENLQLRCLNS
ncbi:hypothetical protein P7H06_15590 [Paenibacillus larvae]|nr:hypothetical protein [Paenibacillus larvae]MDT2260644.1 hypothetical protein [Paenibacillus larvae]